MAATLLAALFAEPAAAAPGDASARAAHVGVDIAIAGVVDMQPVDLDLADVAVGPAESETSNDNVLDLPLLGEVLPIVSAGEVMTSASSNEGGAQASTQLEDVGVDLPLVGDVSGLQGLLDLLNLGVIDLDGLLGMLGLGDLGVGEVLSADLVRAEAVCAAGEAPTAETELPEQITILGQPIDLDTVDFGQPIDVDAGVASATVVLRQETTTDATAAATALEAEIEVDVLGVGSVTAQVTLAEASCESPDGGAPVFALCANVPRDVFADVPPNGTHAANIDCIAAYGITVGKTASTYDPTGSVTRGQMASFIVRLIEDATGQDFQPPASTPMTDLAGNVHADEIKVLLDLGIASGTSATTFSPNQITTRGQIATLTKQAAEFVGYEFPDVPTGPFTDVAGNVHAANIDALAAAGMIVGTTTTTFAPNAGVSRAQEATFLVTAANGLDQQEMWAAPRFEAEA